MALQWLAQSAQWLVQSALQKEGYGFNSSSMVFMFSLGLFGVSADIPPQHDFD